MTCIVGFETEKGVIMGGDSCAANGWNYSILSTKKVFKVDNFLIGCTGSLRVLQLLRYKLSVEKPQTTDDLKYMATTFVDSIKDLFKREAVVYIDKSIETISGNAFLIGYNKKLYKIWSDFQVSPSNIPYAAAGSGEEYALGSLYSTDYSSFSKEQRLLLSLQASANFSNGVYAPFYLERMEENNND